MKKLSVFAIFFLSLALLFSIFFTPSASAQSPIAVAILYENENAPQWNPANNDGSTFPFLPGSSPAQGFGTRIERGTELIGNAYGPIIFGDVDIVASSIVRRDGRSETAALGTGQAHGSISINGGQYQGRFAGGIDLSSHDMGLPSALPGDPNLLPWIPGTGTISGHYNLHGEENLTGGLFGVFLFPMPCLLPDGNTLPVPACSPTYPGYSGFVYSLENDLQTLSFPPVQPFEFVYVPEFGLYFPAVKLVALLFQ